MKSSSMDNCWIVKFNETAYGACPYDGTVVTDELIDKIRDIDCEFRLPFHGYLQFCFAHVICNKIVDRIWINVGDNNSNNDRFFNRLADWIKT